MKTNYKCKHCGKNVLLFLDKVDLVRDKKCFLEVGIGFKCNCTGENGKMYFSYNGNDID